MLCYAMLCYATLRYTILYYTILYYTILCRILGLSGAVGDEDSPPEDKLNNVSLDSSCAPCFRVLGLLRVSGFRFRGLGFRAWRSWGLFMFEV